MDSTNMACKDVPTMQDILLASAKGRGEEMKTCTKCHHEFPLTDQYFSIRSDSPDGFRNDCKVCVKKRRCAWHKKNRQDQIGKMKEYQRKNREVILSNKREYNNKNRDIMIEKSREYYKENREKVLSQMKEYRRENNEAINLKRRNDYPKYAERQKEYIVNNRRMISMKAAIYSANKRKTDTAYRMLLNIRSRICIAVKKSNSHKSNGTTKLIGCTVPELRIHLSEQFVDGMTWENYGQWHIDHIIPCSFFNLNDPEEQRECFHFSNLQPLWAIDNLRKGAKIPASDEILKSMAF